MIFDTEFYHPLKSYICRDADGYYCLPTKYKDSLPPFLFGNPTEEVTKSVISEQYQGGDIFHAGAYVGDFFPSLSNSLNHGNHCITCEPSPLTHSAAQITLRLNNIQNVTCQMLALSDKPEKIEIQTKDEDGNELAQTTRFIKSTKAGSGVEVNANTIDRLTSDLNTKILHLDLEGFEYTALMGARKTLRNNDIIVIIENYQPRIIKEFLSDFVCLGTADHNYFFSRNALSGDFISLISANLLIKNGDIEAATNLLKSIYTANKDSCLISESYAETTLLDTKINHNTAFDIALKNTEKFPIRIKSYEILYKLFSKGFLSNELIKAFSKGAEATKHPNCVYYYITAGIRYGVDLDELKDLAKKYTIEYPKHPELALVLSKVHEKRGEYLSAVKSMEKAIKMRPNNKVFNERLKKLRQCASDS